MKVVTVGTQDNVIRVHEQPSLNSTVLFTIPQGDAAVAEYVDKEWSKVIYNGRSGYIVNCFLKDATDALVTMTTDELKDLCKQIEGLLNTLKKFL